MCRTTDDFHHRHRDDRFDRFKINAFFLNFSISKPFKPFPSSSSLLPNSLTLVFPPRLTGAPLEIDGAKIRPDSPAFVTLHRIVSGKMVKKLAAGSGVPAAAAYGSTEQVRASEGVRFEVYLGEEKILRGIFRRDDSAEAWRMECRCGVDRDSPAPAAVQAIAAVEVLVAAEGHAPMTERVEMANATKRRGRKKGRGFRALEEIPEEKDEGSDGCGCSCDEEWESEGGDEGKEEEMDMVDMEGVRWAVDVGIWVMCFGVGFLVSKASTKTLRRRKLF